MGCAKNSAHLKHVPSNILFDFFVLWSGFGNDDLGEVHSGGVEKDIEGTKERGNERAHPLQLQVKVGLQNVDCSELRNEA